VALNLQVVNRIKMHVMKKHYFLLSLILLVGSYSFAQEDVSFDNDFEPIRKELTSWDPVRGEWLSNSIIAVTNEQPVPKRNFPENYTPNQMLSVVPSETVAKIRGIATTNANDPRSGSQVQWGEVADVLGRPDCQVLKGRSYGDPHLQSLDGARYSFQTVGEFVLAKSNSGKVEVQTRQKSQSDDFSLNTAVAMNVNGDRVSIYAEDYPDANRSTPVRVNGVAVFVDESPYLLKNGGVLRKSRGLYVVDWPTGESASVELRNRSTMSFMNVGINVYPCTNGGYAGLMGNGNGFVNDDFNTSRGVAPVPMVGRGMGDNAEFVEKQRLAFLAKEFAEDHRITQASSLFDYPIGTSTMTFTDRSFPRVHRTLNDLTDNQLAQSRKHCESNGIRGADMEGCIYDNAFLGIQPAKPHVVEDPLAGSIKLGEVNDGRIPEKSKGTIFDLEPEPQPITTNDTDDIQIKDSESNEDSKSGGFDFEKPKSSGGVFQPKPRTTSPRPSAPRPSTPKPRTPKSSFPKSGVIKGGR